MFGLRVYEKYVRDIQPGDYVLLGGIKLLYVSDVEHTGSMMQFVTDAGKLLFPPHDILRVV